MARVESPRVARAQRDLGEQLRAWRKLHSLTIEQVAERARTTRQTVARLERGDGSVGMGIVLEICRALGVLDQLVKSVDPFESDLGRARAEDLLPKRVRS
ncbi:transcriptional regulator [Subtercola boreus]|uniref:Transcriptional regulator n=1 Tax=Subtercola boreus TaxID=120213 RepID=A0A3E0W6J7_9MICO|nr:helix-turn-helix transcriptional regulator [Subtercola boreus]RFA16757.1 transcriptional regulator [Subtercola boreus]